MVDLFVGVFIGLSIAYSLTSGEITVALLLSFSVIADIGLGLIDRSGLLFAVLFMLTFWTLLIGASMSLFIFGYWLGKNLLRVRISIVD